MSTETPAERQARQLLEDAKAKAPLVAETVEALRATRAKGAALTDPNPTAARNAYLAQVLATPPASRQPCAAGCGQPLTRWHVDAEGRHWHPDCLPADAPMPIPAEERIRQLEAELAATVADLDKACEDGAAVQAERDEARTTNQRLNRRAQEAEAKLAAYGRAVAEWQLTDRGTYVPLRTITAIAKAAGREVDPGRYEMHYQRVEHIEAELKRMTELARELAALHITKRVGVYQGGMQGVWCDGCNHAPKPGWLPEADRSVPLPDCTYRAKAKALGLIPTSDARTTPDNPPTSSNTVDNPGQPPAGCTQAEGFCDEHGYHRHPPLGGGSQHIYLSTGCFHGEHGYCQSNTGAAGTKIPAVCKFCQAPCLCDCHQSAKP